MTESIQQTTSNGAGFSPAPASLSAGGFTAGGGWDGYYNFKPGGVQAEGHTPMPSQAKIDRFQRAMAELFVELDVAEKQAAQAEIKDGVDALDGGGRTAEELMAEVDKAIALKKDIFERFCDALADVCSNKPTKKQLQSLNEIDLKRYINHIGGLLNPEV